MKKKELINIEVEEMVLNSIITTPQHLYALENFSIDIFTSAFHKSVCEAILKVHGKMGNLDVLSIYQENNNLSLSELAKIATAGIFYGDLDGKVKYLYELHMLREIVKIGNEATYLAQQQNSDAFELNERMATQLMSILPKNISNTSNIGEYLHEFKKKLEERQATGVTSGIMTGLHSIDKHTNGFKGGDLVILAARPSVGKTALVLKFIADTLFNQKHNVAMFSLEMSKDSLVERMVSAETGIKLSKIVNPKMNEAEWMQFNKFHEKMSDQSNGQLYVNDSPGINILGIRNAAMAFKAKHDIKLLAIDYLQLISGLNTKNDANRQNAVSLISRELKILAKTLDIPVIALSQLSRRVETSSEPKPKLSDLRESGSIEQDADVVMFLYRPNGTNSNPIDEIHIACEKYRQGGLFEQKLHFIKEITKFTEPNHIGSAPSETRTVSISSPTNYRNQEFEDDSPF